MKLIFLVAFAAGFFDGLAMWLREKIYLGA
jgi:hypothetical protein